MGGNPWVVASSAFFFAPAVVSLFRQHLIVTIIYTNAALFSTLYHVHNEQEYADLDVVWASLAVAVSMLLLAVLALHYAPWNWRVFLPFALGLAGMIVYFVAGQAFDAEEARTEHYEIYHSLWHLFVGLAGLILVWTPVDLREANLSYGELYLKISKRMGIYPVGKKVGT